MAGRGAHLCPRCQRR
ncbi:MAG: hypothetical protein LBH76_00805 [Propionibacteriaceae bacterium]|nr:hypothetical protein [Propionibacteriaceae bacterium]